MPQNRIFNIKCPRDLEETVQCLNTDEFEKLSEEPGFEKKGFKDCEDYEEFLDEAHLYCLRQKVAKDLYENGRNFSEIYKSVRQHVLECRHCSWEYVRFLGDYVKRKIKQRAEEDADIPSLVEEVNNLPVERKRVFYMNCLKEADSKYLRILEVKTFQKYKPLDDALLFMFKESKILSVPLRILRKNSLDYEKLNGIFSVN